MTARIIRSGSTNGQYGHLWSWLLAAAVLLAVLLLIAARVAGQQRLQPKPAIRFFPSGKLPAANDFDPDKFLERLIGQFGGELASDEVLDKVEVSWDEELRLGEQGLGELKRRLAARNQSITTRGKDVQYLQKLVALVQPQMKQAERYRRLQVHVAEMGVPNAVAFPGGKIVVSREMLDQAGCEAALVCVLGHELAHLDRGHLLRRMKQWKLAQDRMSKRPAEFTPEAFFDQMGLMYSLLRRPFGPQEELDADHDGITWAYRAGYDPLAVEQVYAAMDNAGLAAPASLPNFLRTHPPTADRRERLRAALVQLQAAEPQANLYLGRLNLTRRIPRLDREFPD
jgi:Zn-dependent protease with chaperone function